MRDAEIKLHLERSALRLDQQSGAVRSAKDESAASLRRAHETTRRLSDEMQRATADAQERFGAQLDEALSAVRRSEAAASELQRAVAIEQARSTNLLAETEALRREFAQRVGAPPTTPRAPPMAATTVAPAPAGYMPSWESAAATRQHEKEPVAGATGGGAPFAPQVVLSRPRVRSAIEPQAHGLDAEYASLVQDPFSEAFESSAAKLRDLDRQNVALQRQCRTFLAGTSSALLGVQAGGGLLKGPPLGMNFRPLPTVMPLPWVAARQAATQASSSEGAEAAPSSGDAGQVAGEWREATDDGGPSGGAVSASADDGGASPVRRPARGDAVWRAQQAGAADLDRAVAYSVGKAQAARGAELDRAVAQGVAKARADAAAETEAARAEAEAQMLRAEQLRIELLKAQAEGSARDKMDRARVEAESRARVEEEGRKSAQAAARREVEMALAAEARAKAVAEAQTAEAATREAEARQAEARMRVKVEEEVRREMAQREGVDAADRAAVLEAQASRRADAQQTVGSASGNQAAAIESAVEAAEADAAAGRQTADELAAERAAEKAAAERAAAMGLENLRREEAARLAAAAEAELQKEAARRKAEDQRRDAEQVKAAEAAAKEAKAAEEEEAKRVSVENARVEETKAAAEEKAKQAALEDASREAAREAKRLQYEKEVSACPI